MKKSIGILYLCTGNYKLFWNDFYESFEKNFLNNMDKYYYIFCDDLDYFEPYKSNDNIYLIHIDALPWPLITLLRFKYFISIEEKIKRHDYLMFSNANIICNDFVSSEEFLPRDEKQEELSFVNHPGYYRKKLVYNYQFERRKKSLAYIPYNCGKTYVIGAMFSGNTNAFLKMSHILNDRIEIDLKHNIIARWHDESHINRYIINKNNYRLLDPGYCYPVGFDLDVCNKIAGVNKMAKFDVDSFKGDNENTRNIISRINRRIKREGSLFFIRDLLLNRNVEEI